jgi:hypothetical protein
MLYTELYIKMLFVKPLFHDWYIWQTFVNFEYYPHCGNGELLQILTTSPFFTDCQYMSQVKRTAESDLCVCVCVWTASVI